VTTPIPEGKGSAAAPRPGGVAGTPAPVSRLAARLGRVMAGLQELAGLAGRRDRAAASGVPSRMPMVPTGGAVGPTISAGGHVCLARDVR